ncbi:hypothetical protein PybrP1_003709 [[Pythium] brassicae (nom. inval.)]|nr:hypothetical protein PybrP1_003709 [[Pythium] brassicae (nom. inval.)]
MALNIEFDGRSRRVRVTPATTMVTEDARAQFGLPAGSFQLLHRRRALDPALPFRLSGVPNNAALELEPLLGTHQTVRVCVQQADGKRVQAPVAADATLASVLAGFKLLPARDGAAFSLSFLQREIAPEDFAGTTLQDLGIVSGSAMFRIQPRTGAVQNAPSAVSAGITRGATSAGAAAPPAPHPPSAPAASQATFVEEQAQPATVPLATTVAPVAQVVADADEEMKEAAPAALSSYEALQLLRDSCFDATARGAVTTLMKILTNVLSHPENDKMRSIRVSNAVFQRSVGQLRGGVEFLQSVGFALDQDALYLVLQSAVDASAALQDGLRLLHTEADDLNIEEAARPQVIVPRAADPSFDAQPRGPSATEVLVDNLKSKQEQLLGHETPARNTVVTLPGRPATAATATGDTGEDVAMDEEHSIDSKLLISTLKAKRAEAEKAKAAFHPNETVQAVLDHVTENLRPAFSSHAFYLYVSPPRQKLSPEKTLAELSLVPAALAYLSWVDAAPASETGVAGSYLCESLVADESAESKDSEEATARVVAYPKPIALDTQAAATGKGDAREDAAAPKAAPAASAASGKKKPSWLKLR